MAKEITTVKELIADIAENRTQKSANAKDEVRVAQAMLNDPTYVVDIYAKDGVVGQYCPYTERRQVAANIIKDGAKVSAREAEEIAGKYQFGKAEAQSMVNFSKEFINTYIETGRKLPLGGRARSNVQLAKKTKESKPATFPAATSINSNGEKVYTTQSNGMSPEFDTIRVFGSAPKWLKEKK